MKTLHFMHLDLRRHCFTALRETHELHMMLSSVPMALVLISGKDVSGMLLIALNRDLHNLNSEKDITLVFNINVIPGSLAFKS